MEENLLLLISFIYLIVQLYLLDFSNPDSEAGASDSETHATTRYSIAEELQKEFE